ncbi:MAG: anaerobic ribonucleoside-triphosphate reductase activating protein, partial [Candidatus Krumholzibacteria bacterium]|nr:anaerobic ribonucleoside-triphosphate reductase activating protein [Candidatus Krumholzibacteria bacterium]
VFTQGCNFRCPFCHNGALIPKNPASGRLIPEEEVLQFLSGRLSKLDGVVVSGGEPTLQPDLASFLGKLKAMGFKIKLDTNGSRPDVLHTLLQSGLVDFVAMDIKAPPAIYDLLTGVRTHVEKLKESISLISQSGIRHEFRTTAVKPLLSEKDILAVKAIVPQGSPHRINPFRRENAFDPKLCNAVQTPNTA